MDDETLDNRLENSYRTERVALKLENILILLSDPELAKQTTCRNTFEDLKKFNREQQDVLATGNRQHYPINSLFIRYAHYKDYLAWVSQIRIPYLDSVLPDCLSNIVHKYAGLNP